MGFRAVLNVFLVATTLVYFFVGSSAEDDLICNRCFRSTCDPKLHPTFCHNGPNFLATLGSNLSLPGDLYCPQNLTEWTKSQYTERCPSTGEHFCGKRVIKVHAIKYKGEASSGQDKDSIMPNGQSPTILTMLKRPNSFTFNYTLFSCIRPKVDCNVEKFPKTRHNFTKTDNKEGKVASTFEYHAEMGREICASCQTNFCNGAYFSNDSVTASLQTGNSTSIASSEKVTFTKSYQFLSMYFVFFILFTGH